MDIENSLVAFTAQKPIEKDDIVIREAKIKPENSLIRVSGNEKVICINPDKENPQAITYTPQIDVPNLYRLAANTPLTENAILSFCQEWGVLKLGTGGKLVGYSDKHLYWVDSITDIKKIFKQLNHLCSVLDEIRQADKHYGKTNYPQEIEGFVSMNWLEFDNGDLDARINFHSGKVASIQRSQTLYDGSTELIKWGDMRSALIYYLGKEINRHLSQTTQTALMYINNKFKPAHLWDQGCFIKPTSLVGVMWYQLADEIQGGRTAYSCQTCKTSFVRMVKPRANPPKYCSNACRQKALRHRKNQKT